MDFRRSTLSRLSFTIGRSHQIRTPDAEPSGPVSGAGAHRSRRRLADAIDEAFRIALSRGDLATAEELLGVMQGTYERARVRASGDRRRSDPLIERARLELEARKAARYRRY